LINFALWNRGARDDWDEFARRVGSSDFAWENVKKVFDQIEDFKDPEYGDDAMARYVKIEREVLSEKGSVAVEYATRLEDFMPDLMKGVEEHGFEINKDVNDGDPTGVGFAPGTSRNGVRVTARMAYLKDVPGNLTIQSGIQVAKVLFEGKRAVGVESINGLKCKFCGGKMMG
jgi:choline dehydrogenase-like flavoprotein